VIVVYLVTTAPRSPSTNLNTTTPICSDPLPLLYARPSMHVVSCHNDTQHQPGQLAVAVLQQFLLSILPVLFTCCFWQV
jgi:hypothetical protein